MCAKRIDVEFPGAGGTLLRGWLYLPATANNSPGLVMAHGFSATREMGLADFAEVFCEADIAVLVYDHRNLGASDGEPRQEINIWAQARDYRYALSWLAERPEVDARRIGIWGSSFSGGEVIAVGACDRRVAAVIANVPFASLAGGETDTDTDTDTKAAFDAIRTNLLDESGGGLADQPGDIMGPFSVVEEEGNELPVFLAVPEATHWFLAHGKHEGSSWRNHVSLRNCFATEPAFDPGICIRYLAPTPLLMVVATEDRLAETEGALRSFERAGEPKQLEMVVGDHFATYQDECFKRTSTLMRDFLLKQL